MRIGGLASGIDTDELINKLMTAERLPLDKMQQQSQKLTWQRDGFREINKALDELDKLLFDMSLSTGYKIKNISSTQENAITATGSSSATDGTYNINVTQLARGEMIVSKTKDISSKSTLEELGLSTNDKLKFNTGKNIKENPEGKPIEIELKEGDTLESILKRITDKNEGVRAFFDDTSKKVVFETTYTGSYNDKGPEISFVDDNKGFFSNKLGFGTNSDEWNQDPENPGSVENPNPNAGSTVTYIKSQNAKFTYNDGLVLESENNSYVMNGITFNFKNTTDGNAKLSVTNDTDKAFDNIMKFINKYNEVVEKLNGTQQEQKNRNFQPLTDEQKKDMTEDQIKNWEEKAKSGLLKGEGIITNGLYSMRSAFYSSVNTDGTFTSISQLGLGTSKNYMDGGKIVLENGSEDKLRKALAEDPESVMKLFTAGNKEDKDAGIVKKLRGSIETTMKEINERAGKPSDTSEKYMIGKNMKDLDKRISDFERRMVQVESRYWTQFNAMEKAINRLNSQSAQMLSQFGG